MEPDEVVHLCFGEIDRYKQAMNDQLPRIKAADEVLGIVRDEIERTRGELLTTPSKSPKAFQELLEANESRDRPYVGRLKSEAQFLLVAVYGILSMARAIRTSSSGELNRCVQRAIADFDKEAPDADLLRHLHEHEDDYLRGKGKDRDRLPKPDDPEFGAFAMLENGGLVYFVGGKLFELNVLVNAANALAWASSTGAAAAGVSSFPRRVALHPHSCIALKLGDHVLISGEDPGVGVTHHRRRPLRRERRPRGATSPRRAANRGRGFTFAILRRKAEDPG